MIARFHVSGLCLVAAMCGSAARGAVVSTDLGGDQYHVRFSVDVPEGTRSVSVAGTFNGWNPQANPLQKENGSNTFAGTVTLSKGRYEYKFVIDGNRWRTDPDNPLRTPGYANAILNLGIDPSEVADSMGRAPTRIAQVAAHPPELVALSDALKASGKDRAGEITQKFQTAHPMPLITDATVSFVYAGEATAPPTARVYAEGARLGYELKPLIPDRAVFAVTLERKAFPERWAYVYAVEQGDRTEIIRDPFGWSVTSRAGQPVTRGVAALPDHGRITLLPDVLASTGGVLARDLYVYLPPGYDTVEARYPLLIMHDGQNAWDDPVEPFGHGGWSVNLVADELIKAGRVEPFIIVGVPNTINRLREYGPGADILSAEKQDYLRYLEHDVLPLIRKRFRVQSGAEHTFLMGSSMGGAISLQATLLQPSIYGGAACLSPALMFDDDEKRGYTDLIQHVGKQSTRLYVDCGTAGESEDGRPATEKLVALLRETGWRNGVDLEFFKDEGAMHNERAWRARVHRPLLFLFAKSDRANASGATEQEKNASRAQ